jgi:hypothetical protein
MKVPLYDLMTGAVLQAWPVDAKEAVKNDPGRWSMSPPADEAAPALPLKGKKAKDAEPDKSTI